MRRDEAVWPAHPTPRRQIGPFLCQSAPLSGWGEAMSTAARLAISGSDEQNLKHLCTEPSERTRSGALPTVKLRDPPVIEGTGVGVCGEGGGGGGAVQDSSIVSFRFQLLVFLSASLPASDPLTCAFLSESLIQSLRSPTQCPREALTSKGQTSPAATLRQTLRIVSMVTALKVFQFRSNRTNTPPPPKKKKKTTKNKTKQTQKTPKTKKPTTKNPKQKNTPPKKKQQNTNKKQTNPT